MRQHTSHSEQLVKEASDWFARLQDAEVSAAEREEFDAWLLRSPEHIQRYLQVSSVWGDMAQGFADAPSVDELVREAQAEKEPENIVHMAASSQRPTERTVSKKEAPASRKKQSHPFVYAAAASIAAAVLTSILWFVTASKDARSHLTTATGEQRSVVLPDGSMAHLNTASEVRVHFGKDERRIELLRGEARFMVAKDMHRPFLVSTPLATVKALGTVFNVRISPRHTAVTVIEGRVALQSSAHRPVALPAAAGRHGLTIRKNGVELGAGQNAAITDTGKMLTDAGPSLEQALAWTDRQLVFREHPLSSVLAEFNRYYEHPIRIKEPELAGLRINGVFDARDVASLIEYLQRYRSVRVETLADGEQVISLNP